MGDSSFTIDKRTSGLTYRLSFQHVNDTLFDFKREVLGLSGMTSNVTTGYGSAAKKFISSALTSSSFPIDKFYNIGRRQFKNGENIFGKRRVVPYEILKEYITLDALSLWIADDGSLSKNNGNQSTPILSISTHSFPWEQIEEFYKLFENKYEVEPTAIVDKRVQTENCNAFLKFKTKDTLYLLNMLRDKHVRGAEYKFYFPTEGYIKRANNEFTFKDFKIRKAGIGTPAYGYNIKVDADGFVVNGMIIRSR
jgi:hypothetical protein